jgi:hypothetical protein
MDSLERVKTHKNWQEFQDHTNISLRHRYVYFSIAKVATTSIKHCLFAIEYEGQPREALSLYDKRASPLLSPFQLRDSDFLEILSEPSFFKFAIVRNPYSRLLSCYLDRILTKSSRPSRNFRHFLQAQGVDPDPLTFDIFIRAVCKQASPRMNAHWRVQYDDLCFPEVDFDFIGHFEDLWDDLAIVSRRIWGRLRPEFKPTDVVHSPKKTGATDLIQEYYTQELADLVYERYSADFKTFGYDRSLSNVCPVRKLKDSAAADGSSATDK